MLKLNVPLALMRISIFVKFVFYSFNCVYKKLQGIELNLHTCSLGRKNMVTIN